MPLRQSLQRVMVVSEYDRHIHSLTLSMALPSVISLREYIAPGQNLLSRGSTFFAWSQPVILANLFLPATRWSCDPKGQGGRTNWNVVAACSPCNLKKGAVRQRKPICRYVANPMFPPLGSYLRMVADFPNFLHESWRAFYIGIRN